MLSGVAQGPFLWPLLFNVLITDLCNSIKHDRCLSFADNVPVSRTVSFARLPSDIDIIRAAKVMALNTGNTRVIAFTRKTNVINYNYKPVIKVKLVPTP